TATRNNGGGYYNHNLYFAHLSPTPKVAPTGKLLEKINATFGSFETLKDLLTKAALGQFGSGWAWLASDHFGNLRVMASPNQDNPIIETRGEWVPILGIDVWEHAYYLKHKNLRGEYLKDLLAVIDWQVVEGNYDNNR
ncbi:MAG: superoxide dismutase, partial [Bacteroidia bacterium]|nr:superoxide dismutase [Bacteroidia bacterium]